MVEATHIPRLNESQQTLYQRITEFSFDEGDEELTFEGRLARENGWTADYTARVIEEYKRFMFLAIVARHPVTPSDQVDQAWHLHLTYTRSYWDRWCKAVLNKPIHHGPTKGGSAEGEKFHDWYEKTKQSYRRFFGESPPEDIWPDSSIRFGEDLHYQRVNLQSHFVIPKFWRRSQGLLAAAVLAPLAMGVGSFSLLAKEEASGRSLLVFLFIIFFAFLVFAARSSKGSRKGKGRGKGGCSGWWGGGFGGCGDGGCGGCGGCGGGGCGGGGCGGGGG